MTVRPPACPACGTAWADPVAARLGYCADPCRDFTGLCGAGRRVRMLAGIIPEIAAVDWRHYCPEFTRGYWRITVPDGPATDTALCPGHEAALAPMVAARWVQAQRILPAPRQPGRIARAFYEAFPGAPGGPQAAGRHA